MAGTAQSKHNDTTPGSVSRQAMIEHQKLVDDMEALRAGFSGLLAKLDADADITAVDFASTLDLAAADLTAAKVKDQNSTIITT